MQITKGNSRPAGTGTAVKSGKIKQTIYRNNYNTKKMILQALIFTFCIGMVISAAIYEFGTILSGDYTYCETEYIVRDGDTLWTIAEQYKPDGVTMQDYMSWVYEHNKGGIIYPGDVVIMGVAE